MQCVDGALSLAIRRHAWMMFDMSDVVENDSLCVCCRKVMSLVVP